MCGRLARSARSRGSGRRESTCGRSDTARKTGDMAPPHCALRPISPAREPIHGSTLIRSLDHGAEAGGKGRIVQGGSKGRVGGGRGGASGGINIAEDSRCFLHFFVPWAERCTNCASLSILSTPADAIPCGAASRARPGPNHDTDSEGEPAWVRCLSGP